IFVGDKKLACDAILCLQATGVLSPECHPSLGRFHSIFGRNLAKTIEKRVQFLSQCPISLDVINHLKQKGLLEEKSSVEHLYCNVNYLSKIARFPFCKLERIGQEYRWACKRTSGGIAIYSNCLQEKGGYTCQKAQDRHKPFPTPSFCKNLYKDGNSVVSDVEKEQEND
ncbi:MAG: TrbM/KikA/MpfK family conjugal transfer protein, partial [Neisseriaceae bacterium]